MAITNQLEIGEKTLKSLYPVNIETGAVGLGEGTWLLSVHRSYVHWVRAGCACCRCWRVLFAQFFSPLSF